MVACGSSRNAHNMQLFATADLAMSATPKPPVREHGLMYGEGARRGWVRDRYLTLPYLTLPHLTLPYLTLPQTLARVRGATG